MYSVRVCESVRQVQPRRLEEATWTCCMFACPQHSLPGRPGHGRVVDMPGTRASVHKFSPPTGPWWPSLETLFSSRKISEMFPSLAPFHGSLCGELFILRPLSRLLNQSKWSPQDWCIALSMKTFPLMCKQIKVGGGGRGRKGNQARWHVERNPLCERLFIFLSLSMGGKKACIKARMLGREDFTVNNNIYMSRRGTVTYCIDKLNSGPGFWYKISSPVILYLNYKGWWTDYFGPDGVALIHSVWWHEDSGKTGDFQQFNLPGPISTHSIPLGTPVQAQPSCFLRRGG